MKLIGFAAFQRPDSNGHSVNLAAADTSRLIGSSVRIVDRVGFVRSEDPHVGTVTEAAVVPNAGEIPARFRGVAVAFFGAPETTGPALRVEIQLSGSKAAVSIEELFADPGAVAALSSSWVSTGIRTDELSAVSVEFMKDLYPTDPYQIAWPAEEMVSR
jgi:hypothetical protein